MKRFLLAVLQNLTGALLALGIFALLLLLSAKSALRLDLTDEKEFSVSPATKAVLGKLEDRLSVKLYFSKNLPPRLNYVRQETDDLLKELQALSKQEILIEDADPDSNEMKEQETQQIGIIPVEINMIEKDRQEVKKAYMGLAMYYRDKREVIPVLAKTDSLEYEIAMALLKMSAKDKPKIGLLMPPTQADNPESDAYRIVKQMLDQLGGFQVVSFNEKNITKLGLKAFVIIEPKDLPEAFTAQLDGLLEDGVDVVVFSGHINVNNMMIATRQPGGLDAWLENKGVGISQAMMLDPAQSVQAAFKGEFGQLFMAYPFWMRVFSDQLSASHPITSRLEEIVFPWASSILLDENKAAPWTIDILASSGRMSFMQPGNEPDADPQFINKMTELPNVGPQPLSVMLSPKSGKGGRLFVTADHYLMQDNFLQQAPVNAVFLQNLVEYASWGDAVIGIRSRGKTARELSEVSETAKSAIKWGHALGIPLAVLSLGLAGLFFKARARRRRLRELEPVVFF